MGEAGGRAVLVWDTRVVSRVGGWWGLVRGWGDRRGSPADAPPGSRGHPALRGGADHPVGHELAWPWTKVKVAPRKHRRAWIGSTELPVATVVWVTVAVATVVWVTVVVPVARG